MNNGLISFMRHDPILRDVERSFNTFWDFGNLPFLIEKTKLPKVNAYLKGEGLVIDCIVPYVKKEDISINIDNNLRKIVIEGEVHQDEDIQSHFCREVSRTSFSRSFGVPKTYDLEKAEAELVDGILKITVPIAKESEKQTKTINIK